MNKIVSLFAEDRLKPSSLWNEYFLRIENNMMFTVLDGFAEEYQRVFAPSSLSVKNSSFVSKMPAAFARQELFNKFNHERQSSMLLQLKTCANAACCQVELTAGEYKTCSKCRLVYYCSVSCQTTDWKRHKRIDCKPSNK